MHNFDSLETLCTNLDYTFDVIAVTETWNAEKNKDKFIPKFLPGYEKYNGIRGTTLKSGCGLYIKSGTKYIDRKDLDINFHDDLNEFQSKFIEIINEKQANIILNVTYRHPKNTSDNTFNVKLQETLEKLQDTHKILISLGDFNYNLFNYEKDVNIKTFVDTMYGHNMQATIDKPTRVVKKQKPALIDNIFTNAVDKDIVTGNLISKISDHMPNFIIMKDVNFDHKKINKRVRSTKNFNLEEYRKDVSEIDIEPVLTLRNVHEVYEYFHKQYMIILDKHAPYIILENKELKWKLKPWITKHIQNLITSKEKLYKKFLRKRDDFWFNRYNACKEELKHLLKNAKQEYISKHINDNLGNSRKIWKAINEIIHNKFTRDTTDIYLDDNGNIITNQKLVANRFNKFYTNVAKNLVKKLGKPNTKYQDYLKNPNEHSIFLSETDPGEVAKLLSNLDTSKSGDIYGITPKLMTLASNELAPNLSKIFNKCIQTGIFPQYLKKAKVIPIHKGDSKMLAANYRPISLLPIIGKIFEKIIFSRFTDFISKYKLLYRKQYGFQKGKSTEHALIDIHEKILTALENRESPCCILLDFAKAFDTVDHKILLDKLYYYGIRGNAHQLIKSYLTDREQCVQINNTLSDMDFISYGVPQGSILGPLLFLLYINDIASTSKILSFYLFADDTTIFYSHKDIKTLEKTINQELLHITDWLIANKLSLNVSKTKVLLFRTKNESNAQKINICLNGVKLEESVYAKYLGVLIDNKLTFEHHIHQVKSKLVKGNVILAKVRHYAPYKVIHNTYNAHIQPHVDYGLNVWGYAADTHLQDIVSQMKKALHIINFKKKDYPDTASLYKNSKILPFEQNTALCTGKLLWKIANDFIDSDLNSLFRKKNASSFYLPYRRLQITQRCISYKGVQTWNRIPQDIRNSMSPNTFKTKFKSYLLDPQGTSNINNNINNMNTMNNTRNTNMRNPTNRRNNRYNLQARNNFYGQLRHDRPRPRFQSRWDDGPVNLI